jgi:iron(III) transport system ATP-binding protein
MMRRMTAISLCGLSKRFPNGATALSHIDLDIRRGEFLALLGPSGCGKTTLLRLLAGFESPSSGQILFDGALIADAQRSLPAERRDVGLVFQSYALWPHLSVAENIAYPLRVKKLPAAQRAQQVDAALAQMGLEAHADKRPDQLSGGQRQRVALARCLVQRPRLTLLDEPLASLDVHLRDQMMEAIRDFHAALGGTLIYVTHDQHEAMALADRIAVFNAGQLEQVDTPQALHDAPLSEFVARFIGRGRLIPVTLETHGDGVLARCADLRFALRSHSAQSPHPHAHALIRPADVTLRCGAPNVRVLRQRYRGQGYELELELLGASGARLLCDHALAQQPGALLCADIQSGWLIGAAWSMFASANKADQPRHQSVTALA